MDRKSYLLSPLTMFCIIKGGKYSLLVFLLIVLLLAFSPSSEQDDLFFKNIFEKTIAVFTYALLFFLVFGIPSVTLPTVLGSVILAFWVNKGDVSTKSVKSKSLIAGIFIGCTIPFVLLFLSIIGYQGFLPLSEISNRVLLGAIFISMLYGGVVGILFGKDLSKLIVYEVA
jgi:hypothetical protein